MIILLLMIDILLYYITNWKIFCWIGWFIVISCLCILVFYIATFISIYIKII